MKDPVDQDTLRMLLEIDAIVLRPAAQQLAPVALDLAETSGVERVEVFRQKMEFSPEIELELLGSAAISAALIELKII